MAKTFGHRVAEEVSKVMANIDDYVIPENQRAIEWLWDHNVMTTQTNDYNNKESFISIGKLSEENMQIFNDYSNGRKKLPEGVQGRIGLGYGHGFFVPVVPGDKDPFDEFFKLFSLFKPQDVQKDGYMTIEEFYINCTDCFEWVKNPNYKTEPVRENYKSLDEYYAAFNKYLDSLVDGTPYIKVFAPDKCVKDFKEYLKDAGLADCYDEEEEKVFLNRRIYEGHMRYKKQYGSKKMESI